MFYVAPFINMFSLPVNSGWKPVPTSNKLAILPLIFTLPLVGDVTLLKTFNKVLLPAPFLPIIPTASPVFISKLKSFRLYTISLVPIFDLSFVSPIFKKGSSLPLANAHHLSISLEIVPVLNCPNW